MEIYKKGQGTFIRAAALGAFVLIWLYGCRWIFLLPHSASRWFNRAVLTWADVLAVGAVLGAGVWLYRVIVLGKGDRELLRWGALTGGLVLAGFLLPWGAHALLDPMSGLFQRQAVGLPLRWGEFVCAGIFAYGPWAAFSLVANHPRRVDFLIETETELRKVAWPARREYLGASVVVIACALLISLYLTVVDGVLSQVFGRWLSLGF